MARDPITMKSRIILFLLLLAGWSIAYFRRRLIARLLKLPPPQYKVGVTRDLGVTMRDGVRLLTDHYYPRADGEFPTILMRTPYGRGREGRLFGGYPLSEMPAQRFAERGYHVVVQGARGCLDSEGVFTPHLNEREDGAATVAWIERQPWFSGVLGTWGPSYLGYMQWAVASAQPSVLRAMVPIVTSAGNFSVTHPDGAFGLETRLRWAQGMQRMNEEHRRPLRQLLKRRLSDKREEDLQAAFSTLPLRQADEVAAGQPIPFLRDLLTHRDINDPFWAARDHSGAVEEVTAAVHLIGGWYDYYLRGIMRDYAVLQAAGRSPYLTIGPWNHANPGPMIVGLREGITWFEAQLKGKKQQLRQKPVRLFVMGREEWREFEAFPPASQSATQYLQAVSRLSTQPPPADSPADHYRYDPTKPTPSCGGAILGGDNAGAVDNHELEARADVLVYNSKPLAAPVTIIGTVRLTLYARSSLTHTDFFARLCDGTADGRSLNVCDGLLRVKPESAQRQADGTVLLNIELWPTAHCFRAGHRLRLQISSGAHPAGAAIWAQGSRSTRVWLRPRRSSASTTMPRIRPRSHCPCG